MDGWREVPQRPENVESLRKKHAKTWLIVGIVVLCIGFGAGDLFPWNLPICMLGGGIIGYNYRRI